MSCVLPSLLAAHETSITATPGQMTGGCFCPQILFPLPRARPGWVRPNVLALISVMVNAVMLVTSGVSRPTATTRLGRLIFVVAEQQVFVLIAHPGLLGWTALAGTG